MIQVTSPPRASLLGLPTELRDQILQEVFRERVPVRIALRRKHATGPGASRASQADDDMYWDSEKRTWRLRIRTASATERQKAYLLPTHDGNKYHLTSKAPIACVNTFLRAEISRFLQMAVLDVVAEIEQFDFGYIQAFLSSLPATRLQDFVVREDGRSTSSLSVCLRRPPGGTLGRSSANLEKWLPFVPSLFPADNPSPELATAYRIFPDAFTEHESHTSSTQPLVQMMYSKHEKRMPGADKLDLYKIMHAWWARWRVEGHLLHGGTWTRHASPDDLHLLSLR